MNVRELINLKLFSIAALVGLVGYVLLAQAPVDNPLSLTVAPVVIVICYLILIPLAILKTAKSGSEN